MTTAFVASLLASLTSAGQEAIPVQGPFVEPLSQVAFPEKVEGWTRARVMKYPEPGGYSATYELRIGQGLESVATAYVYPQGAFWPSDPKEHFDRTFCEMKTMAPNGEIVLQRAQPPLADTGPEWWVGAVLFRGGLTPRGVPVFAYLRIARGSTYWFKWRIDAPMTLSDFTRERLQKLTAAFPLASQ
jgi:hypothetical protein